MVVAVRMVEREALKLIWFSTKSDAFVMILTMLVTIIFDLIMAIEVGMVAAGILFIIRISRMFSINPETLTGSTLASHESLEQAEADRRLLRDHIIAYRIDGPIFFGAASRFFDQLLKTDMDVSGKAIKIVILRLRRVPIMDASGATALKTLIERLERKKILVFISGLQEQPQSLLSRMGIINEISREKHHLFKTTEEAIEHAYRHLKQGDHHLPTRPV